MVYLSAPNEAVSVALLMERDGRQAPIHYVSRTLQGAEINYPPMEKLVLALVHAARRLKRYFQGHTIKISHIPREEKRKADALSKLAAVQCEGLTKGVLIKELNERSVDATEVNAIIEEATRTWMTPIQ
ncbi:reverse transcriptase domain-containing protein [Tanacetum coccineum]